MIGYSKNSGGKMDKLGKLEKTRSLLQQAIKSTDSILGNSDVAEARKSMRRALSAVEHASKSQNKKKNQNQNQFESWWQNIESGATNMAGTAMSPESQIKSLNDLDKLIDSEKGKLKELEKEAGSVQINDRLLEG